MITDLIRDLGIKDITEHQKLDFAIRLGQSLFIEKNKAYRTDKIDKR